MTDLVNKANRKDANNTLNKFAGKCNKCLNNCESCVDDWFITPAKSC